MNARRACLAILVALGAISAQAANTVDPHSTGATDVLEDVSGTLTMLTNPLADPLELGGDLIVGDTGSGELLIDDGSSVSSLGSYVARQVGSVATVTVEGSDSKWTTQKDLYVGQWGHGTLNVLSGAAVENPVSYASVGRESGSVGVLNVDGPESTVSLLKSLSLGTAGDGTLQVTNGAAVVSSYGGLASWRGSMAMATVDGDGSTWSIAGGLSVAGSGHGTLNISHGGHVTALGTTRVGEEPESRGSILFDEGTLTTGTLYASPDQLLGTGTIHATSLFSDIDLVFDATHGFEQTFEFNALPDQNITLHLDADPLGVVGAGYRGTGTLRIADGVAVEGSRCYLGLQEGATGIANIEGPGSSWTVEHDLYIGYVGHGTLQVTEGGTVSVGNRGINVGYNVGAAGAVVVDGAGSTLSSNSDLWVGGGGAQGELLIANGGLVTSDRGLVGSAHNSSGTATVDGVGSLWSSESIIVGNYSHGSLFITGGGKVESDYVSAITKEATASEISVDGPGSSLVVHERLRIGHYSGPGVLTVSAGGLVKVDSSLVIDEFLYGNGFIRMSTGGQLVLAGDAAGSLSEFLDLVTGTDDFSYWDESLGDWAPLTSATYGDDYTLKYLSAGELAGYTLLTVGTLPALAGDYNGDGIVNVADYTVWRNNLGSTAATAFANGSRAAGIEGVIGQDDYLTWKDNFGARVSALPVPTAVVAVPEPTSVFLLLAAIAWIRPVSRLAFRRPEP